MTDLHAAEGPTCWLAARLLGIASYRYDDRQQHPGRSLHQLSDKEEPEKAEHLATNNILRAKFMA